MVLRLACAVALLAVVACGPHRPFAPPGSRSSIGAAVGPPEPLDSGLFPPDAGPDAGPADGGLPDVAPLPDLS